MQTPSFHLEKGACFSTKAALKNALNVHAANNGYEYTIKANNKCTFIAICASHSDDTTDKSTDNICQFRLYAKGEQGLECIVRGWCPNHVCPGKRYQTRTAFGGDWVASMVKNKIKYNRNYPPTQIITDIRVEYGATITYDTAWKARKICRSKINESFSSSYATLPFYFEELRKGNKGSTVITS